MKDSNVLSTSTRSYDLDWLRVLAFSLLIVYHAGMIFAIPNWYIANAEQSILILYFIKFTHLWRLPLLFLISGMAISYALKRRTYQQFIQNRLQRLLIPFIVAMLICYPPQIYFFHLSRGITYTSYWEFLYVFGQDYFSFETWGGIYYRTRHLWFIIYLLTFSLGCLPIFLHLKSTEGQHWLKEMLLFFKELNGKGFIFMIVIPLTILDSFCTRVLIQIVPDYGLVEHGYCLLFFIYGFILTTSPTFLQVVHSFKKKMLGLACISSVIYFVIYVYDYEPYFQTLAIDLLSNTVRVAWITAILGYGKQYLSFNSPLLKYCNEAVYPFYLLHQPILIALAFYSIPLPLEVHTKFILVSLATFFVTWIVYELGIRPWKPIRPLFGLTNKKSPVRFRVKSKAKQVFRV